MNRSVAKRVTVIVGAIVLLVLVLGGVLYFRTISNAQQIDNRNLRELDRIGQSIEGRVNNLHSILKSIANDKEFGDPDFDTDTLLDNKTKLIPNLSAKFIVAHPFTKDTLQLERTAYEINLAEKLLSLWYDGRQNTVKKIIHADFDLAALEPALVSDYMESVFLADIKGSVFLSVSNRTGIRILELTALDTLYNQSGVTNSGIGASTILRTSIAGQKYRIYLMPLQINLYSPDFLKNSGKQGNSRWVLGGMIPASEHRQQSLSLDPSIALILGFLVIAGFLAAPFILVFTMGPKERLKVGHLFYLITALVLGSGFAGLILADFSHFYPLKSDTKNQLIATAKAVVENLDDELMAALSELENHNRELHTRINKLTGTVASNDKPIINIDSERFAEHAMKDTILLQRIMYPYYHMVFWTDSDGMQIAKWTPRSHNTARVSVAGRGYFRAIRDNRGWKSSFFENWIENSVETDSIKKTDSSPYFMESIRSWTTGENLAAISVPWEYIDENNVHRKGIAAIITKPASLTQPVLPAGVGIAVVDANANTLFHTRPERVLEENFAEETNKSDLLQSILTARANSDLEVKYGGHRNLLVVRPLPDRPLFLIVYKDRSLLDTVRFEAWFEGAALFGGMAFLILILIVIAGFIIPNRIGLISPDFDNPGKYAALAGISFLIIIMQMAFIIPSDHLHIHPATLIIPVQFLALGHLLLSPNKQIDPRSKGVTFGWGLFIIATAVLFITIPKFGYPFPADIFTILAILVMTLAWRNRPDIRKRMDDWIKAISPRWFYTLSMFLSLVVLGVLPGYRTYQFTFHEHSKHLVKYHQLELAESLTARETRINHIMRDGRKDAYRNEMKIKSFDMAFRGLIFETDTVSISDTVETSISNHNHNGDLKDFHDILHNLLSERIPFLSEVSVNMRQLSPDQVVDRKWDNNKRHTKIELVANDLPITSTLPQSANLIFSWRILVLIGVLAGIIFVIYWAGRQMFFIHLEHSDPLKLNDVLPKPGGDWKSMILLGTRSISRNPIHRRSDEAYMIDMISAETGEGDTPALSLDEAPENVKAVCLDHFDHRIDEAKWSRRVLGFLEKNVYSKKPVSFILLTSRNPEEVLMTAESGGILSEEEKRRWDRLLGRFTKIIIADIESEKNFEISIITRTVRKLADDLYEMIIEAGKLINNGTNGQDKLNKVKHLFEKSDVKLEWLDEELDRLIDIAKTSDNNDHQEGYGMGTNLPNPELKDLAHILEKKLGSMNVELRKLNEGIDKLRDKILSEKSAVLADRTKQTAEKVSSIIAGKPMDAVPGNGKAAAPAIGGLMKKIIHAINSLRMDEIEVHYEKEKIRSIGNTLLNECGGHNRLHEIGRQILDRPDWFDLKHDEIVDLVRERAKTYYTARWAILSDRERLVAAQLATGALVSPRSYQPVKNLLARGFVKKVPNLRLDNENFTHFVQKTVSRDTLNKWERADTPSTWEIIRWPLLIVLFGAALFLFWAQRDFLGGTVAFLGTAGASLGAILKILSVFDRGTGILNSKD